MNFIGVEGCFNLSFIGVTFPESNLDYWLGLSFLALLFPTESVSLSLSSVWWVLSKVLVWDFSKGSMIMRRLDLWDWSFGSCFSSSYSITKFWEKPIFHSMNWIILLVTFDILSLIVVSKSLIFLQCMDIWESSMTILLFVSASISP